MKRNKFSLSHMKMLSMKMGELVPISLYPVIPGDTIQQATSALVRLAPLLAPVMTPLHARIHHWYVPLRIIWEDFEDFITGGEDGMDASVFPTITFGSGVGQSTLSDYLGVPPKGTAFTTSALPYRVYSMIWNEWYRDQDLQTKIGLQLSSGNDTTTNVDMQNVAWEKDYFTTSRPWTQKGPEVTLPLGTSAPITGLGMANQTYAAGGANRYETGGNIVTYADEAGSAQLTVEEDPGNPGYPNIRADLTTATAASINDLRLAMALQRYEEARARYGSRYTEYLRYLGITPSDARLQRPEYLGGGKQTIQFSEVLQTGVTTDGDDLDGVGNLKGHGIGALRSNRFRRFFEEHGYVISLMSVKPRTIYGDGLPREWFKRTKEDFFQRELQHIGQQEIYTGEVRFASATPNNGWGAYQDRYDEYRRIESSIAGEFRSTLNYWHMARQFASDPALNADFIKSDPTTRIFAQGASSHPLYVMANHSIQARRMLAAQGTPLSF